MAALKIPKQGRIIELAQLLEPGIPAYPPRAWHQLILAHGQLEATLVEPDGAHVSWFEEHVNQTYQIGCHLDGLAHLGIDGRLLQRHELQGHLRADRPAAPRHRARAAVGRARRVPRHRRDRGHRHARGGLRDLAGAHRGGLREAGRRRRPGRCRLFHTGWSSLWMVDNARYGALEPGLGWDGAHWLTERRVSLVGADNWALEPWPPERAGQAARRAPAPAVRDGHVHHREHQTKELVDGGISEFLFLLAPNKTKGSTGSMTAPVAVV